MMGMTAMTSQSPNSLCALVGHDLRAMDEESGSIYWLVPPSTCLQCGAMYEGIEGVPPASRPRDFGRFKLRTATLKATDD